MTSQSETNLSDNPFLKRPHLVLVSCFLVVLLGVLSLLDLPKDLLPVAKLPAVQILSFYSGMSVERIEKSLTRRIELYTGQATGVIRQESKSLAGVSIVRNYFDPSIDLNTALTQTTTLVMSVLRRLPPGTQPPLILPFDPTSTVPLALVAVSGEKSEKELYDIARYRVRNLIQSIPGGMAPTVMGGAERAINVELDSRKMAQMNFAPLDVVDLLNKFNSFVPSGNISIGDLDYQILSNGMVDHVEDMNEFPLRADRGTDISIMKVGKAIDGNKIQTNMVTVDGKPQVYVPVFRQAGGNSLAIVDSAKIALKKLESELGGIRLSLVADQSGFVRNAIHTIAEETLIGGGLAALFVLLILGNIQATVGVLIAIPLSILFGMLGLLASGQSINAMTLGGIALSIGVLVDNSIVVIENISRKLDRGLSPFEAANQGVGEVALPVLASTISTLIVLFPVVLLGGISKILFSALALSITFAMIGSYYASMVVVPLYSAHFLRSKLGNETQKRGILVYSRRAIDRLVNGYQKLLGKVLANRVYICIPVVSILVAGGIYGVRLGTELFPRADTGNFTVNVRLPSGTRIEKTREQGLLMEKVIREIIPPSDLRMVIMNAGVYFGFPAAFTPNSGSQDLFFNIQLNEDRKRSSQEYARFIRSELPKKFQNIELGIELGGLLTSALNGGQRAPIDIQIGGRELATAQKLGLKLAEQIKSLPGAIDVRVQQRMDAPQLHLEVDRKKAGEFGLSVDQVMKDVVSAVSGSVSFNSTSVWVDPKSGIDYSLGVIFPRKQLASRDELLSIPTKSPRADFPVPLRKIASVADKKGATEINHVDLQNVVNIFLDAQGRDVGSLARDVRKVLDRFKWPEGYHAEVRGEIREMEETAGRFAKGFILAVILVYLVLVVQFKSFLLPLIVLATLPLGICGIPIALGMTRTYFSIQSGMGAIFLIGIAVANGVLLIEFIAHRVKEGDSLKIRESILNAAGERFRPILMTSMASILGLVPMSLGLSLGSEANVPLGRAVVGGQLIATVMTLFLVPLLFELLLPYLGSAFQPAYVTPDTGVPSTKRRSS
jgi:multidrug efflux pump subunit AcrB